MHIIYAFNLHRLGDRDRNRGSTQRQEGGETETGSQIQNDRDKKDNRVHTGQNIPSAALLRGFSFPLFSQKGMSSRSVGVCGPTVGVMPMSW